MTNLEEAVREIERLKAEIERKDEALNAIANLPTIQNDAVIAARIAYRALTTEEDTRMTVEWICHNQDCQAMWSDNDNCEEHEKECPYCWEMDCTKIVDESEEDK